MERSGFAISPAVSPPRAHRLLLVSTRRQGRGTLSLVRANASPALDLVESRDPSEALSRVLNERFDAVAVELPREKAFEFASLVRKRRDQVVVILLGPDGDHEFKRLALQAGAHAVVSGWGNAKARLGLLETTLETLALAAVNRTLAAEAWATARSLARVVEESRELKSQRKQARPSSGAALPLKFPRPFPSGDARRERPSSRPLDGPPGPRR